MSVRILTGDCRTVLRSLPEQSVHCCVTSPPYFGLRDYGHAGQIGLETTPRAYVAELVEVFREVRRVLRNDGTLWLNLGDTTRDKQLLGIPWRVAFALQADGWWLRSSIIWHKPNPMPESVTDRPTSAHENIFLLAKSERYWFDADAVRQPLTEWSKKALDGKWKRKDRNPCPDRNNADGSYAAGANYATGINPLGSNIRNVWTVATQPFADAHFATFPPALIEPCIKAGCPDGGTVLDPFGGAGTTGLVADRLQRNAVLVELNPEYAAMARRRIEREAGMFATVELEAAP